MSDKVIVTKSKITSIANLLRSKMKTTGKISLDKMSNIINRSSSLKFDIESSGADKITFYASQLKSLDLSMLDTSLISDMSYMFCNCEALTSLDLSGFNTANVGSMRYMFSNCSSLTSLDVSNFDTSNVTNMSSMFRNCNALTSLDLSSFNTAKVTDMTNMFYKCTSLITLKIGKSTDTAAQPITASDIFSSCPSTLKIYVPDALVDTYKAATNWSTYASQIYPQSECPI